VALPALPDVDVELPVNGLSRDLHLELLGDVRTGKAQPATPTPSHAVAVVRLLPVVRLDLDPSKPVVRLDLSPSA
jgi:hypothetical protein